MDIALDIDMVSIMCPDKLGTLVGIPMAYSIPILRYLSGGKLVSGFL